MGLLLPLVCLSTVAAVLCFELDLWPRRGRDGAAYLDCMRVSAFHAYFPHSMRKLGSSPECFASLALCSRAGWAGAGEPRAERGCKREGFFSLLTHTQDARAPQPHTHTQDPCQRARTGIRPRWWNPEPPTRSGRCRATRPSCPRAVTSARNHTLLFFSPARALVRQGRATGEAVGVPL